MTFAKMVETTPNLYPTSVDEALQNTIYDWFQFRKVVDDEKFPVFFRRVLNRDLDRYNELLRVEPGIAKYDWMVESYLERQMISSEIMHGETSNENNTTSSDTQTNNLTNTDRDDNVRTVVGSGSDTKTGTENSEGSNTSQASGTDTTTNNLSDKETRNLTNERSYTGSEANTRTGSESDNKTLSYGAYETQVETKNNQSKTTNTNSDSGTSNAMKAGPMDAGIVSSSSPGTGSAGSLSVGFDSHASQIGQERNHQDGSTTESWSGNADLQTTTYDQRSDGETGSRTYNNVKDEKTFTNRKDTETATGTDETTHTGTSALQYGRKDEGSATVDTETSETTTYGKTTTDTFGGTKTNTQTGTVKNDNTVEGSSTGTTDTQNDKDTKEVLTGRHKEPAEIMEKVVAFVQKTNAWTWLQGQLEPCFMATYDI